MNNKQNCFKLTFRLTTMIQSVNADGLHSCPTFSRLHLQTSVCLTWTTFLPTYSLVQNQRFLTHTGTNKSYQTFKVVRIRDRRVGFAGDIDCVTISSISGIRLRPGMLKIDAASGSSCIFGGRSLK